MNGNKKKTEMIETNALHLHKVTTRKMTAHKMDHPVTRQRYQSCTVSDSCC